jgi:hypothetical protein
MPMSRLEPLILEPRTEIKRKTYPFADLIWIVDHVFNGTGLMKFNGLVDPCPWTQYMALWTWSTAFSIET